MLKPPVAVPATKSDVFKHVQFRQKQMAKELDKRNSATVTKIKAEDTLRILLPHREHKLAIAYSQPNKVVRVAGNCIYLDSGTRWDLRRALPHKSCLRQTEPTNSTASRSTRPK